MQQQPKILCSCGTINEPGTHRCSNPECNSLLTITGQLYSDGTIPTRNKRPSQTLPFVPPAGTPNGQAFRKTPPTKVQSPAPGLPTPPKPKTSRKVIVGVLVIIVLLVFCIPSGLLLSHAKIWPFSGPTKPTPTSVVKLPTLPTGIGSKQIPNGQYAGVNDGSSYPFDTQRKDPQNLRLQAMQALQTGDSGSGKAISLWHQYLSGENENDAEILIYLENQNIVHQNYVTLMVGLDFPKFSTDSPDAITPTRSALQGAYVAQKEFNDRSKDLKLRLLLVNTADDDTYVARVAQQMSSIIKGDTTVIGILGWQTSKRTESMLEDLKGDGVTLPMVSQTASSDNLTNEGWSNLFRIAPLNNAQAQAAVLQAKKLQATNAIVLVDIREPYSQNLGEDITKDFEKSFPGTQPIEENFTVENTSARQFVQLLKDALNKVKDRNHAVVFFTGTTDQDVLRFQDALASYPDLQAIAGDAGYVAEKSSHGRWYFVAYAYHDEWQALMGNKSLFSQEYSAAFDPESHGGGYGRSIADAVVFISYDAANILLRGIEIARSKGAAKPTGKDLQNSLLTITGSNAWQGVSGLINFNGDREATNKSLITLWVDSKGFINMLCIQGQFASTATNGLPQC